MKSYLAFAFAGAASAMDIESEFMDYVAKFGKMIGTIEEFNFRKEIFTATHNLI